MTENMTETKSKENDKKKLAVLSLAALGVVFGDIGTSPLYAVRECFHGDYAIQISKANIYGVLSLMFWALTLVVSLKYLTFIMRADNNGEGGVIALTSLVNRLGKSSKPLMLVGFGLFGASLLYGDGMITPAISVLSALEGIEIVTPAFEEFIIPLTIIILAGLFLIQSKGTGKIGSLFGPIVLLWFLTLAVLGIVHIISYPQIFMAFSPHWGIHFLFNNGIHGFMVLGAVFLVVTGAEALYADMGHFGKTPIRLVWYFVVLPSLVLNYFGQGALLINHPENANKLFYSMVPSWGIIPVLVLATLATIIASQAVITGAFSLTAQAIQLGYLPRLKIVHTSSSHKGQIYVPIVNWLLMISTITLVLVFQSSSKLAAAYGVAVTSTMLIATMLFYVVARKQWGWSLLGAMSLTGLFLMVDIAFFMANISKIMHGAWFPLVVGAIIFIMLITWKKGRSLCAIKLKETSMKLSEFLNSETATSALKVKGTALFLAGTYDVAPVALVHNTEHNHILHNQIILLHFQAINIPRVPNSEKVQWEKLGSGFSQVKLSYGFVETLNFGNILSLLKGNGLEINENEFSVFLGRQKLVATNEPTMAIWRKHLFIKMAENAQDVALFFNIPIDKTIEVGVPLEL